MSFIFEKNDPSLLYIHPKNISHSLKLHFIKNIMTDDLIQEYEEVYKFLYRNLGFWGDDEDTQDAAIIIIKEGMVNHSLCADPEINLSATIVKLDRMRRGL